MEPDLSADDTERLVAALRELQPRSARLLELRCLHGKTDDDVAGVYGMPASSYAVHLLRAARSFMAAYMPVWGSAERDVPLVVEQNEGAELVRALQKGQPSPSVSALVRALNHLREHAPSVRARMDALAKQEAESPAARREALIRRVLVAVLVVVTLYLYFTGSTRF